MNTFFSVPGRARRLRKGRCFLCVALVLALFAAAGLERPAHAQQTTPTPQQQARADMKGTDLRGKDGPFSKVGYDLALLYRRYERFQQQGGVGTFSSGQKMTAVRDGHIVIDAIAKPGQAQALRAALEAVGLREASVSGPLVSGLLPIESIGRAAQIGVLRSARPAAAATRVGAVTSQGVRSLNARQAREDFGVNGSGVTVGTLSDSYNCLGGASGDVTSGDLPRGVRVLKDLQGGQCNTASGSDEGRAMMQIIHDVAPGTDQAFYTAFLGSADFANGIRRLAETGSGIVVDDVIYLSEPMFQPGQIAQAVDDVVAGGTAYFSSAGNNGDLSYESEYRGVDPAEAPPVISPDNEVGELHDFDPGPGIDVVQRIIIPEGTTLQFSFQWDQPYASAGGPGSQSDIDIAIVTKDGNLIEDSDPDDDVLPPIGGADNIDGDPIELLEFTNDGSFDVDDDGVADTEFGFVIEYFSGPKPDLVKYVMFGPSGFDVSEWEFFTNSPTLYGHANAEGAVAVGAAAYFNTPAFNPERTDFGASALSTAVINDFSALGGVPLLFDEAGNRLSQPLVQQKPEIVGPDGGNTTFFGGDLPPDPFDQLADDDTFGNFFGTSAAAPHVAGVAALMREFSPALTPSAIYSNLENTALDMNNPATEGFDEGFDFRTGFGFVQAVEAVPLGGALLAFDAVALDGGGGIRVTWTISESAEFDRFVVERCFGSCDADDEFTPIETVEAAEDVREYALEFDPPIPGRYTLRLRQVREDGTDTLGRTVEVVVGVSEEVAVLGPFPNPFRSTAQLVVVTQSSQLNVTVEAYDVLGRQVATLLDGGTLNAEEPRVITLDGSRLASGMYFIRIITDDFTETRQAVVVR